ncbi:hypothetical protein ACPOL_5831 [Acidisarcina polymorpha]|uniref:Uncharacterized protein n=2 Tax=Acidisarcina polymorpha TaxID=2211140 RepID=A0A2Z5G8T8_9BACT|nr:hypothetical protein ACPOL_5831 [Acidisarcina polymorpha]
MVLLVAAFYVGSDQLIRKLDRLTTSEALSGTFSSLRSSVGQLSTIGLMIVPVAWIFATYTASRGH